LSTMVISPPPVAGAGLRFIAGSRISIVWRLPVAIALPERPVTVPVSVAKILLKTEARAETGRRVPTMMRREIEVIAARAERDLRYFA